MNFKGFKKVSEDEKTATMAHPNGHQITIVKASLSKDLLKKLKALPLHQSDPDGPIPDVNADQGDQGQSLNLPSGTYSMQDLQAMGSTPQAAQSLPQSMPPAIQQPPSSPGASQDPYMQYAQQLPGGPEALQAGQLGVQAAQNYAGQANQAVNQAMKDQDDAKAMLLQNYNDYSTEAAQAAKDIQNNFIKPNQYLENMSTPQHVATAIGLILGGAGQGMAHLASNPALDLLNKQIDRNLESQRLNQGTRMNLLSALHQKFGNQMAAENMFKSINSLQMAMQLQKAAANAGIPLAQQQQLLQQSGLVQQGAMWARQATLFNAMQDLNNPHPQGQGPSLDSKVQTLLPEMRMFMPDQAKDLESRYVPGTDSLAQVPLTDKDRESLQEDTALAASLQRGQQFLNRVGAKGAWSPADIAEGNQLKREQTIGLQALSAAKRLNERELKLYQDMVPNYSSSHFTGIDQNKLSELTTALKSKSDSVLKSKGIQGSLYKFHQLPSGHLTLSPSQMVP